MTTTITHYTDDTEPPDPAVIPDCPPWCGLPAGHMYSSLTADRLGVTRDHDSNPRCLLAGVYPSNGVSGVGHQ